MLTERIQAVWKLEAASAWYITFDKREIVDDLVQYDHFQGSGDRDQRKIILRVLWLPIWASSQRVKDELKMFVNVDDVSYETLDGIMTGVRLVHITVRENDIPKRPYSVLIDGCMGWSPCRGG